MKITDHTDDRESKIVIAMIQSDFVLGGIAACWKPEGLFKSEYTNVVARLCIEYYQDYQHAPKQEIWELITAWVNHCPSTDFAQNVETFCNSLGYREEIEIANPQRILDMAGKYFTSVRLLRLSGNIDNLCRQGKVKEAVEDVNNFCRVEIGSQATFHILSDYKLPYLLLSEEIQRPLVTYPDALGYFFGNSLRKGQFVSFMAPEKAGKSFWLLDVAYRAVEQRHNVAFFSIGDMTEDEVANRFWARLCWKPYSSPKGKWPYKVKIPTSVTTKRVDKKKISDPRFKEESYEEPFTPEDTVEAIKKFQKRVVKSFRNMLKLTSHPNLSIGIHGIRSQLDTWTRQGWEPEVVIIDYADNLAMSGKLKDPLDQTDMLWKQLRALSMSHHCLVVTATQTNRKSYGVPLLGPEHINGDKRKLAHVNTMIGINVMIREKAKQICRLNLVKSRENDETRCVTVAGCLALASPAMYSCW